MVFDEKSMRVFLLTSSPVARSMSCSGLDSRHNPFNDILFFFQCCAGKDTTPMIVSTALPIVDDMGLTESRLRSWLLQDTLRSGKYAWSILLAV